MGRWLACALLLVACSQPKASPPPAPRPTIAFERRANGIHVIATVPEGFALHDADPTTIAVGASFEPGAWDEVGFMFEDDSGGATPEAVVRGLDLRDRTILRAPGEIAPGRFARVTTRSPLGKPKTKCQTVDARWSVAGDLARCTAVNCDGRWRDLLEVCRTATIERIQ